MKKVQGDWKNFWVTTMAWKSMREGGKGLSIGEASDSTAGIDLWGRADGL